MMLTVKEVPPKTVLDGLGNPAVICIAEFGWPLSGEVMTWAWAESGPADALKSLICPISPATVKSKITVLQTSVRS